MLHQCALHKDGAEALSNQTRGQREASPAKHRICFVYGGEYQTAVTALRWSRGYFWELCWGQWNGLPPAECFYEVL